MKRWKVFRKFMRAAAESSAKRMNFLVPLEKPQVWFLLFDLKRALNNAGIGLLRAKANNRKNSRKVTRARKRRDLIRTRFNQVKDHLNKRGVNPWEINMRLKEEGL